MYEAWIKIYYMFYVQKHTAPQPICYNPPLVRDKPAAMSAHICETHLLKVRINQAQFDRDLKSAKMYFGAIFEILTWLGGELSYEHAKNLVKYITM